MNYIYIIWNENMKSDGKKSFQKSLLDTPVPKLAYSKKSKLIKALPPPLVPTKYVPQKPVPKPRTQKSKRPVPMPRSIPEPIFTKVKKVIKEITPYYRPDAIRKFNQELRDKKNLAVGVIEKARALKSYAKSFEVSIVSRKDATKQLYYTSFDVSKALEDNLYIDKGLKANVTLKILMKKKKNRRW